MKEIPTFINKPFPELSKEEVRGMRRNYPRIDLYDFLKYYEIDAENYVDRMKELGFAILRDEKAEGVKARDFKAPPKQPEKPKLTRVEMMAVRMFRGYSQREFASKIGISVGVIESYEKGEKEPKPYVIDRYILATKIIEPELRRIRMALSRETEGLEIERNIPDIVKQEVSAKTNGKCAKCGEGKNLHFHHIKHFADGGLHRVDNLLMLCADCHAEEHKEEHVYKLLKSLVDKSDKEDCE